MWLEIWFLLSVFAITSRLSFQMKTTHQRKSFKHHLLMKLLWLLLPKKWACFCRKEMRPISDFKTHLVSPRNTISSRTSLSAQRPNVWVSLWDTERVESWCFMLKELMLLWFLRLSQASVMSVKNTVKTCQWTDSGLLLLATRWYQSKRTNNLRSILEMRKPRWLTELAKCKRLLVV